MNCSEQTLGQVLANSIRRSYDTWDAQFSLRRHMAEIPDGVRVHVFLVVVIYST